MMTQTVLEFWVDKKVDINLVVNKIEEIREKSNTKCKFVGKLISIGENDVSTLFCLIITFAKTNEDDNFNMYIKDLSNYLLSLKPVGEEVEQYYSLIYDFAKMSHELLINFMHTKIQLMVEMKKENKNDITN